MRLNDNQKKIFGSQKHCNIEYIEPDDKRMKIRLNENG